MKMLVKRWKALRVLTEEMKFVREMRKEECYLRFVTKENYVWQTRDLRRQ